MPTKIFCTLLLLLTWSPTHGLASAMPPSHIDVGSYRSAMFTDPRHGQQPDAMFLAKKWDDLSPNEKQRVREAQDRYRNLPEDKQQKLRKKWEKMPDKEREKYKLERRYR